MLCYFWRSKSERGNLGHVVQKNSYHTRNDIKHQPKVTKLGHEQYNMETHIVGGKGKYAIFHNGVVGKCLG